MAKTLVVGDLHLKSYEVLPKVEDILADDAAIDRVVFLGDYCDEWGATDDKMIREIDEFTDWVELRRARGLHIDVLFGNHDFQYLLGEEGPGTHMGLVDYVRSTLLELDPQIACEVDGFLLTHAGLTQWFADEYLDDPADAAEAAQQLNDMLAENTVSARRALFSCGVERGGDEAPGPLWADKWELEEDPVDDIPQIVGHSPVASVCQGELPRVDDSAPELWFCDTFSLRSDMVPIGDGSMLLLDNGRVSVLYQQKMHP